MKIAQKIHEKHTSYKREINATTEASIHSEVRFFPNGGKSKPMEQGNEKQSRRIVCLETLELIYMSPSRARQKTTLPLAFKL
jgi:D-hexose-6-phosphate mutarotase